MLDTGATNKDLLIDNINKPRACEYKTAKSKLPTSFVFNTCTSIRQNTEHYVPDICDSISVFLS